MEHFFFCLGFLAMWWLADKAYVAIVDYELHSELGIPSPWSFSTAKCNKCRASVCTKKERPPCSQLLSSEHFLRELL